MDKPTEKEFAKFDRHELKAARSGTEDGLECGCKTCLRVTAWLTSRTAPLKVVEVSRA